MLKLLDIDEVAALLKVSAKTVKRLPIQFSRMGRRRRYDLRDVEAYRKDSLECPSSNAQDRRIGTRKSTSEGIGLSEALARHPAVKPKPSTESTGSRSRPAPAGQSDRA